MEKNYYEILEIDKNASSEIIKKAYNTLAKKYHPDLQDDSLKPKYEEKLKLINEAYEVLSNPEKKNLYDSSLANLSVSREDYDAICAENELLRNKLQQIKYSSSQSSHQDTSSKQFYNINSFQDENVYRQNLEEARRKAYYDAYIQDLKNRGYKIRYKKTPKDYFKNFIAFVLTILILFLLWQIPFVRNFVLSPLS